MICSILLYYFSYVDLTIESFVISLKLLTKIVTLVRFLRNKCKILLLQYIIYKSEMNNLNLEMQ